MKLTFRSIYIPTKREKWKFHLRLYKTPTCENNVIQTPWNLSGIYKKVHSVGLANKILPGIIFEHWTSKVGYTSDLSKYNIWFQLRR